MVATEQTVATHVTQTMQLLEAMAERHSAMEQSVRSVGEKQDSFLQRLELVEGKLARADVQVSGTRTSENDNAPQKPAIIVSLERSPQSPAVTQESRARHLGSAHEAAWQTLSRNVGGLKLLALRRGGICLFTGPLVVCLQEIICDPGKFHDTLEDLQIIFGKGPEDWRGNAVVHSPDMKHTRGKMLLSQLHVS